MLTNPAGNDPQLNGNTQSGAGDMDVPNQSTQQNQQNAQQNAALAIPGAATLKIDGNGGNMAIPAQTVMTAHNAQNGGGSNAAQQQSQSQQGGTQQGNQPRAQNQPMTKQGTRLGDLIKSTV